MSAQIRLDDSNLPDYLRKTGLLSPGDEAAVEPVGDGNINWVRRVRCVPDGRSWVVKQARPALERFPQYRVSTRRIAIESRYYETAARFDRERICPRVFLFDPVARVLVLEDLGDAERLDRALARGADAAPAARSVGGFLGAMHAATRGAELAARFENDEMRRLHGDHIFHLPYRPNDFPLSPTVRARARSIWRDRALVAIIDAAHTRYLEPRGALVHGDVQSGNILLARGGPKLLDAEIAHVGDPAFDLGIFVAHLLVPAAARGAGDTAAGAIAATWSAYTHAGPPHDEVPFREVARYAGIELLRRTIGAARLAPVEREEAALAVLDVGIALTASPPDQPDAMARV